MICSLVGCRRRVLARGLCKGHYDQWWRRRRASGETGPPRRTCKVEGCDRPAKARRLCGAHYARVWRAKPRARTAVDVPNLPRVADPDWRERAACRGQDTAIWFPEVGQSARAALELCAACPADVRESCLADALALPRGEDAAGVRGGLTVDQRRTLRRQYATRSRETA